MKDKIGLYRRIQNAARLEGHTFHNDWVETAWYREISEKQPWEDIRDIVDHVNTAIKHADVLITEASDVSAFGVGYEVASALQQNKPVLALVEQKKSNISYVKGIHHDLLTYKEYIDTDLEEIVRNFLKVNTITTKDLRFNFVIDRKIYNHLRAKSFETGKTKAEIVRELLIKDSGNSL